MGGEGREHTREAAHLPRPCPTALTDADGVQVHEVGQLLALLSLLLPPPPLVDTHTDEVRAHVLRSNGGQEVIGAILHQREFSSIEDHAHLREGGRGGGREGGREGCVCVWVGGCPHNSNDVHSHSQSRTSHSLPTAMGSVQEEGQKGRRKGM